MEVYRLTGGFVVLSTEFDLMVEKVKDYYKAILDLGMLLIRMKNKTLSKADALEVRNAVSFLDELGKTEIANMAIRAVFPGNSHLAYRSYRDRSQSKSEFVTKRYDVMHGELLF